MIAPVKTAADDSPDFIQSEGNVPVVSHAWQPTNEPDVLNPLGGNTQDGQLASGSDKPAILSLDDPNFAQKTMLNYGADGYDAKTNPAYAISKYATQAKNATGQVIPGHYDVTLTAQGNRKTTEETKPLDIVFVVDLSGSMETTKGQAPGTPRVPRFIYNEAGRAYVRTDRTVNGLFTQDRIDGVGLFQQYLLQADVNSGRTPAVTDYRFRKVQPGQPDEWYEIENVGSRFFPEYELTPIVNPGNLTRNDDAGTRADYLRDGVSDTLNWIQQQGDLAGQLSVGMVGFSGPTSTTNNIGVDIGPIDDTASKINQALNTDFCGSTWTQNGLERGQQMLEKMPASDTKLLILLTDGDPSYYGEGPQPRGTGTAGTATPGSAYWTETIKAAESIQKTTRIQGIGIETADEADFKQLTSLKPSSQEHDYTAVSDAADISKELQSDVKFDVTQYVSPPTISDGTISDPLGSHYDYMGNNATVSLTGSGVTDAQRAAIQNNLTLDPSTRRLTVKDLTLGKGQKATITYQVALNTEATDFVPDKWYPMNGTTTLTPTPNDPPVNFGIPAGRGPGTKIKVSKTWQDTGTGRPDAITFTIKRTTDNGPAQSWSTTGKLNPSSTAAQSNTWEGNLTKADGQDLILPRYSKDGQLFTYHLSEDPVPGYQSAPPITNTTPPGQLATQRFSLTNKPTVPPTTLRIKKINADTGSPLGGATFAVTALSLNVQADGKEFASGPLTLGQQYEVQETKAPSGFVGLSQSLFITAGKDGTVKVRLADGTEQSLTPGDSTPTRLNSLVSAQVTTTDADGKASREIVLTVGNHQRGFLPHTGSDDLLRLMLISFSFAGLAIALLALAFWQRRKEGDDE